MALKKYNNVLTSRMLSKKYLKDTHILDLVGVGQKITYNSKKQSQKSNRDPTAGYPDYIRDFPP